MVFVGAPVAYRGLFLIDRDGIVRHQLVNDRFLGPRTPPFPRCNFAAPPGLMPSGAVVFAFPLFIGLGPLCAAATASGSFQPQGGGLGGGPARAAAAHCAGPRCRNGAAPVGALRFAGRV
uniref:Uncharacterized protein n=1 Tax=Tanacetum cinerariifolium TaxID=118510 RepID=A0A699RFP7_TANCI|nr:hypothetical protein [Tanacetum cinerariifolium]